MFIEALCVRVYNCKKHIWSSSEWINWPILKCNPLSNKNEQTTDKYGNTVKSQKHYAKLK